MSAATTTPLGGRQRTLQRFRLRVVDGPCSGADVVSDGAELAVGSAPGNQLVLDDAAVSRHHLVITASDRQIELRDLGSTNGTYVAGLRIKALYLHAATAIALGRSTLAFEPIADAIYEPLSAEPRHGGALGTSAAMRRIFALVPRVAAADSPVLLEGESGTGKSLLAAAIHAASARGTAPLVVIDCSALPAPRLERELFEAGGALAGARTGTLIIDEIAELPLELQARLLRLLEGTPIGARLIATTRCDLRRAVNQAAFRADLFYRLSILRLHIPPLRERRDDLPLLAAHFHEQVTGQPGASPPAALLAALDRHDWPGNVRELRGAVERAALIGEFGADPAPSTDAPATAFDPSLPFRAAKERHLTRWERDYVRELVALAGGNVSKAARLARMDRNHLRELIERYGL